MNDASPIAADQAPTRALRHRVAGDLAPVRAPADELPAPRNSPPQISNYEIGEQIGAGGMGRIYKAAHTWLGRMVAIKFIAKESFGDPETAARFAHEIRALGRLDHPNIVRATDAGCVGGSHFLVTEFVDGCDLARLVKTIGPLRIADACEIICQAALGLQHAHQRHLIHRDVKPSNLLLSRGGTVKLLDFGLARLSSNQTTLTTTGQMIGTLDFLAPEQAADARQVDIRGDIYSLGCTLYFLLAGQAPFSGPEHSTAASKIKAHLADEPPPLVQRRGRIPLSLSACLERMMAKSPDDRYQTPAEIAAALARHARGANLPRLASLAANAGAVAADEGADDPIWDGMLRVAGSVSSAVGRLLRGLFRRRSTTQNARRREPILSVSGVIALVVIGLIIWHFSHFVHLTPGQARLSGGPPGAEVHYFRIGPARDDGR